MLPPGPSLPDYFSYVQHMQKALERMNVKLHDMISSLVGACGLAVVEAILQGERDPARLLALCDVQIQNKKSQRVKEALRSTWAEEHLFSLRQALESWRHYQQQMAAGDGRLKRCCENWPARRRLSLARKLAELLWRAMVKGMTYVEKGLQRFEEQVLETKRRILCKLARQLGQVVQPSFPELKTNALVHGGWKVGADGIRPIGCMFAGPVLLNSVSSGAAQICLHFEKQNGDATRAASP